MSNRKCDRWLKLGSTEYDVFLVESLKLEPVCTGARYLRVYSIESVYSHV